MFGIKDLYNLPKFKAKPSAGFHLFRALSSDPAESQENGNINIRTSGTVATPVLYTATPPEDEIWAVFRMTVNIRDTGSFDSGGYGNGPALTNGIQLRVGAPGIPPGAGNLTPVLVRRTTDWQIYAHDLIISNFGQGDEVASIRWTFSKAGFPMILHGRLGQFIELRVQDDLSGLEHQYVILQGIKLNAE